MTTPSTIHLVSALRGGNKTTLEAATILDQWFSERVGAMTSQLLDVCREIVIAVESRDQRAIWEAAKLAQVQLDKPSPPAPAPS